MSLGRRSSPSGTSRRTVLKAAAASSLGGLLAGCGGLQAGGRRGQIAGGFVDDGVEVGHRLRDGSLGAQGRAGGAERARVLVIGGGIAGLSAAWRLAREGVDDIAIVDLGREAGGTSRGGRMGPPGSPGSLGSLGGAGGAGLACPFGAHYLPQPRVEQLALAAFLGDSGISTGVTPDGRVAVPDRLLVRDPAERVAGLGHFEEGLWLEAGSRPSDVDELDRFEAEVERMIAADAGGKRFFDLPVERSSEAMRALDAESALAWTESMGLSGERIRWYLEYATRDDLGASLADTSAWALMHYFTARADLATKESAAYITWPDGNAELVRQLARLVAPALHGKGIVTREAAVAVMPGAGGAQSTAVTVNADTGATTTWTADAIVVATPQFVTTRLLSEDPAQAARRAFRYSPWLVANLYLSERPETRGFPYAWDSVIYGSESLGYVDACHQLDRDDAKDTVWSWYLPVTDSDERAARQTMLDRPWDSWRDAILKDLRVCHPNIEDVTESIDVWRWGHAMVKPTPGTMWGGIREAAKAPIGSVHFAHSDLSGIALFEEANWQGVRAAEEILRAMGRDAESLL